MRLYACGLRAEEVAPAMGWTIAEALQFRAHLRMLMDKEL